MADKTYPNVTKMRRMQRIPGAIPDPEGDAPIYGDYKRAKIEGAHYDVECSEWGDNETPTDVEYTEGLGGTKEK